MESIKRHVTVIHLVDIKHPVTEHVLAGLQVHVVDLLLLILVAIVLATCSLM